MSGEMGRYWEELEEVKPVTRIYSIKFLIEKKKNEILLWFVDLNVSFIFNLKSSG